MNSTFSAEKIIFIFALCVFSLSALLPIFSLYSWHDHQRIAEVFLLFIICFISVLNVRNFTFRGWWLVFLFFFIGCVSSMYSIYFDWAMKEWSRCFGLFCLVIFVSKINRSRWVERAICFILFLIGFFLSFQFLNYYAMAFLTGVQNLDSYFLLYGFDNPRFLAQFQAVLLPMLAVFLLQAHEVKKRSQVVFIFIVLLVQWVMVWSMAGRGLLLGYFIACCSLFFIRKDFLKFILFQFYIAASGYFLFFIMFDLVPYFFDFKAGVRDLLRYGLSGREMIWWQAIEMILTDPFLGVGPMHYSAVWNHVAAHPHQLLLLVFSEWGMPAGFLFCYFVFNYFRCGAFFIRNGAVTNFDGGVWLILVSAFVLGQVDGVFVMPYGEVWLAIIIGIAVSRWGVGSKYVGGGFVVVPFALMAALILFCVLIFEAPNLLIKEDSFFNDNAIGSPPRFWGQGWIPM